MAKRVNDLTNATLPLVSTDKILVSRDGLTINKATAADIPVSTAVQAAIDVKAELTAAQKSNAAITGVVASTASGGFVGADGKLRTLAPKRSVPLLSPMDFYNAIYTSAGESLTKEMAFNPGGYSIKFNGAVAGSTYHAVRLNTSRAVFDGDKLELIFYVKFPDYQNSPPPPPSIGLTISPDDVTGSPVNYKSIAIPNDMISPGWNRLVLSISGNASVNRNDWVGAGSVGATDSVKIRYLSMFVSWPAAIPAEDRLTYISAINLIPNDQYDLDIPTLVIGSDTFGTQGLTADLMDWMESVGVVGYLQGRTIFFTQQKIDAIKLRQSRGWDVGHMADGLAGVDVNWATYDAAYPTAADRLNAFKASFESADAKFAAAGITRNAIFAYPQNGFFMSGNEWMLAEKGVKAIRLSRSARQGGNLKPGYMPYAHSFDFGSVGTATTYANTFRGYLLRLIDNGGILAPYFHDVIADSATPDGTALQQRIGEIKKFVEAALDLQSKGLLRIKKYSDLI